MPYEPLQNRELQTPPPPLLAVRRPLSEAVKTLSLGSPHAARPHALQRLTDGASPALAIHRPIVQRTLPDGAPDNDQIVIGHNTTAHDAVADIKAKIISGWDTKTEHHDGPGGSTRWRIAWGSNTAFIGFYISADPHQVTVYHAQSQANKDASQAAKKDDYKKGGDKDKGLQDWFAARKGGGGAGAGAGGSAAAAPA